MKAEDLKVVKAIPGNDKCCDCGMKHPQWASVSFGNVFCLECSGVHRSLGVHISFVRSIAMDSWTPVQLTIMKAGGNDACNQYLWKKGIPKTASIKEKYDSDAAALYKLVIKARAEGKPEPTVLPPSTKGAARPTYTSARTAPAGAANANAKAPIGGGMGGGGGGSQSQDASGMERLAGESDAQYIARQTRLREEAKARMAAKFGGNGKRTMGGVGSSPYPGQGGGHGGHGQGGIDMNSLSDSLSSGVGFAASGLSSAFSFAKESVSSVEAKSVAKDMTNMGMGLWSAFSSGAKEVASGLNVNLDMDDDGDGLSALQEKVRRERSARGSNSVYSGFGSDTASANASASASASTHSNGGMNNNSMSMQMPIAVDRNSKSAAPLPGENDADYMQRQIRIRDEATNTANTTSATATAPRTTGKAAVVKMKVDKLDEDFFASFGA